MGTMFETPENWQEFLNELYLQESGLGSIRFKGSFSHPEQSNRLALVYSFFDGKVIQADVRSRRYDHPRLEGIGDWIFLIDDVSPPFSSPQFLEFEFNKSPKLVQQFWNQFGTRAANAGYQLSDIDIGLDPEHNYVHLLMNPKKTEVRDHPWLDQRLPTLKEMYKVIE